MDKMVMNILETVLAALCFCFLLGRFWELLRALSGY